ncbi:MAG: capsular exopolysaccharide family [Frankiales bacterium]|nr:capsular exopolysaccharide family [Frankiales bacterium]
MQLRDYAGMFRRHLLTLLLCVLAGLAGGIFHGTHGADTYEATSRSLLSIPASQTVQEQVAAAQLSGQLLSTYVQVATSRELAERVVARSPEFGSVDHVRKSLSASAEKATYLIDITASAGTKQGSAALANAAASALSDVIESLQTGRAEPVTALLLDKAVAPTNPSSPRPVRDISIGLALGLLVGVLLVLLQEALDSSIKSVAQAERATKSTVLASVARRRRGLPLAAATSATEQGEAFRSLRTAVQYLNDGRMPQTMLVTSSGEGDGKTTVAGNLTASLASAGHRVVLVDADLRRAGLTRQLQMQGGLGLSGVLDGTAQLDQAIRPWIDNADVLLLVAARRTPQSFWVRSPWARCSMTWPRGTSSSSSMLLRLWPSPTRSSLPRKWRRPSSWCGTARPREAARSRPLGWSPPSGAAWPGWC